MMRTKISKVAGVVAAMMCASQPVAQETEPLVLQEIIVTSSKRETTLQDTAITVTVVTAETMEQAHIQDFIDLQSVVPALRISQQQSTANTNFYIRGFGNGANNAGVEPSVGVFVDGVYRSRIGAAINDFPRLDRIEVLSGPQSTLFGKNASAGVISIVTPTPSGDTGGYISGSVGSDNAVLVKGLYEGSASDELTYDVSGSYHRRDGLFTNLETGQDLNDRNRFNVRGQIHYKPSEKSRWRIIADHNEIDEACCDVVNVTSTPQATGLVAALGGRSVPNDPDAVTVYNNVEAENEISNTGISVQFDHEFERATFTSISAFRNSEVFDNTDGDFTSLDIIGRFAGDTSIDTITQEVRLASTTPDRLSWLVGGFYFNESIDITSDIVFGDDFRSLVALQAQAAGLPISLEQAELLAGVPVGSFYASGSGTLDTFTLENESFSLFGEMDYSFTDAIVGTLGLNYTRDDKEFTSRQTLTELRSTLALPGPLALLPVFAPNSIDTPNSVESNKIEDDDLSYSLRLQWAPTENLNIYGSYATGFKASSVNLSRDSAPTAVDFARLQTAGLAEPNSVAGTRFARPEESEIFELGIKALLNNGAINVAVFDQKISDFQAQLFNGTNLILINAGDSSVRGLDFDISYLPMDSLLLTFKGTLLDSNVNFGGGFDIDSGAADELTAINDVNVSLSAQYDFSFYGAEAFVRGDYQYVEGAPLLPGLPDSLAPTEVNTVNISTGIVFSNGISVTLWGRNITDDAYLLSAFPSTGQPGSISGFRNEPRTFGVTLRKQF